MSVRIEKIQSGRKEPAIYGSHRQLSHKQIHEDTNCHEQTREVDMRKTEKSRPREQCLMYSYSEVRL